MHQVIWRSKENLDFCRVYKYCSAFGEYVLFMEDDVKVTNDIIAKILENLSKPPLIHSEDWFMYSLYVPYDVGDNDFHRNLPSPFKCCTQGIVFQSSDVNRLTKYIKARYAKKPIDWLLKEYLQISGRSLYIAYPNMVQHIAQVSSLTNVTGLRNHTSPTFVEF